MLKIAVCDDDINHCQHITKVINANFSDNNYALSVSAFNDPKDLVALNEQLNEIDIFLLDIVMPSISGIDVAKTIRTYNKTAIIIFLTSSSDFGVKAFKVRAFNYLLKPVSDQKLIDSLVEAIRTITNITTPYLIVANSSRAHKIFFSDIIYAEVKGHDICFYLSSGETIECLSSKVSFASLTEPLLKDFRFICPHKSYVVNMTYAKSLVGNTFLMEGTHTVPISKTALRIAKCTYLDFLSNKNFFIGGVDKYA